MTLPSGQCRGISSIILYNHVKLYSDERGQKSCAPEIRLITAINQSPFMDARSHTSHSDAHVTASQTRTIITLSCIKIFFNSPVLWSARKAEVKKLILRPQRKLERTLLGAAVCVGLGLNDLQRLYSKLVAELRIEAGNPGSWCYSRYTIPAFSQRGQSGTQLDLDVARGHSALVRLHSGIFPQLKCKSPVLEPIKQL